MEKPSPTPLAGAPPDVRYHVTGDAPLPLGHFTMQSRAQTR